MTRRDLITLAACAAPISCGQHGEKEVLTKASQLSRRDNILILDYTLNAHTPTNASVGRLMLWEEGTSAPFAIAPDSECIVWIPRSTFPSAPDYSSRPLVAVWDGHAAWTLTYKGIRAGAVAVSSKYRNLYLTAFDDATSPGRLLHLQGEQLKASLDITSVAGNLDLSAVERLSTCSDGTMLAIGTRESLKVVDPKSGRGYFSGNGRFPALSPDGKRVAFVDQGSLFIVDVVDGSRRRFLSRGTVWGVGGWSPDGELLLAAYREGLSFFKQLVVVDTASGQFANIFEMGEGDFGSRAMWIKQDLINRKPPIEDQ